MKISVGIPTVGRDTLAHTLRSLERQTVAPHEVIIINQGDPELPARMPSLPNATFVHQPVRGLSRARNAAFDRFTGDWIAFIDDDEEANAEWIEQIGLAIAAYPQVDFLGGVYFLPVGHNRDEGFCSELYALGEQLITKETWLRTMGHPTFQRDAWGGNCMFSRKCFETVGYYDEWLGRGAPDFISGEDTDYALRSLSAGLTGLVSCRIIIYHTYGTRPYSSEMEKEHATLGAVAKWKSERDPAKVSPELAQLVFPFGKKKAGVATLTGGRVFGDHLSQKQAFDEAMALLEREYTVEAGRLQKRA